MRISTTAFVAGLLALNTSAQQPHKQEPHQQPPRAATLEQQKTCADQAKKVFDARRDKTNAANAIQYFTNHYDPKANVC